MCDRLQDRLQRGDGHSHVQQVSGKEEVVHVAQDGEGEVPQVVQELLAKRRRKEIILWCFRKVNLI